MLNIIHETLNGFVSFRYVSIGDIARVGSHPPNVAAVYRNTDRLFALPVGYDLVRNLLSITII